MAKTRWEGGHCTKLHTITTCNRLYSNLFNSCLFFMCNCSVYSHFKWILEYPNIVKAAFVTQCSRQQVSALDVCVGLDKA